jgi:outer membrane protein TolC
MKAMPPWFLRLLGALISWLAIVESARADDQGLSELRRFLSASMKHAAQVEEARAVALQKEAEASQGKGRLWPSFRAAAGYTRNQYEVLAQFPNGTGGTKSATITPSDQWDANLELNVPIANLVTNYQLGASAAEAKVSQGHLDSTREDVARQVARAYFQWVGAQALVQSAHKAVAVSEENLAAVNVRLGSGLASELERERATAEIESARQAIFDADLLRRQAHRNLETLSGLPVVEPSPALPSDLSPVGGLAEWQAKVAQLAAVRVASDRVLVAEHQLSAAKAAYAPSLEGTAKERFTNAVGFGFSPVWALGITATWRLEAGAPAGVRAVGAGVEAAKARLRGARQTALDAIGDAHDQVESQRLRVQAAQAQERASEQAVKVAQVRYEAGTGTQLDVLQSSRDALSARGNRIRAEADLAFARVALRIAAGKLDEVLP